MLAIIVTGSTVLQIKTYRDMLLYYTNSTSNKNKNQNENENKNKNQENVSQSIGSDQKMDKGNHRNALHIFLWLYSIFWSTIFVLKVMEYLDHQALVLSFIDWTTCIFKNFLKANQPDAWRAVCGNTPKFKLSFSFVCWGVLWTSCHSLLVVAIYIPELWLYGMCYSTGQKIGFEVKPNEKNYNDGLPMRTISEDINIGTVVHVQDIEGVGSMEKQYYPTSNQNNNENENENENVKNTYQNSWPMSASSNEHKL